MDEVRDIKAQCLTDPEKLLWRTTTNGMQEVRNIFYKIQQLTYSDRPDYNYIREQLNTLLQKEETKYSQTSSDTRETVTVLLLSFILEKKKAYCLCHAKSFFPL